MISFKTKLNILLLMIMISALAFIPSVFAMGGMGGMGGFGGFGGFGGMGGSSSSGGLGLFSWQMVDRSGIFSGMGITQDPVMNWNLMAGNTYMPQTVDATAIPSGILALPGTVMPGAGGAGAGLMANWGAGPAAMTGAGFGGASFGGFGGANTLMAGGAGGGTLMTSVMTPVATVTTGTATAIPSGILALPGTVMPGAGGAGAGLMTNWGAGPAAMTGAGFGGSSFGGFGGANTLMAGGAGGGTLMTSVMTPVTTVTTGTAIPSGILALPGTVMPGAGGAGAGLMANWGAGPAAMTGAGAGAGLMVNWGAGPAAMTGGTMLYAPATFMLMNPSIVTTAPVATVAPVTTTLL